MTSIAPSMNGHANFKKAIIGNYEQKPPSDHVDPAAIPDGLRLFDRWLGWRWEWRSDRNKWDKPPVNVRTGGAGSITNEATWSRFDTALNGASAGQFDGIGFVLGESDGGVHFAGIDLDDCRNPETGELTEVARDIVAMMDTYTEISPSGTGIKLLCIGTLPSGSKTKNKAGTVEVYVGGRYFTITGQRVQGTPKRVEQRQEQLATVWNKYIGSEQPERNLRASSGGTRATSPALAAMLRHKPAEDEQDGSKRLFLICCRAVEHDLSDDAVLEAVRQYEQRFPFPFEWSDSDVLRRLRDAELRTDRGAALATATRHTTDVGNAERFADQHGAEVRYCHAWHKWLVWDGQRWAIDSSGEVMRRAKLTARSIYNEAADAADKHEAEALAKWATGSERRERVNAMVALAESEPSIPIPVERLDAETWLLNCENGTVDLRTGELREHRREDYLTKCCPVEYPTDAGDEPILWLEFLDRIFDGNAELIAFLQRLVGVALVGEVREHILPILYGVGANGKSVFIETICAMLGGDYAMNAPSGLLIATKSNRHPTELADLHGKRLVAAVETADGGRLSESLIKELTGGDSIRARRMRENFWQFRPSHTILLATNHKPVIRGTDHGIWRRILLIPFTVTIPEAEQDKELTIKLRSELPAILRWAVAGCLEWQRCGLQAPDEVRLATEGYRTDMDVLGEFIKECCVEGEGEEAQASDLYSAYTEWAKKNGEFVQTQAKFGIRLGDRGFAKNRSPKHGRWIYHGIGLLPLGTTVDDWH